MCVCVCMISNKTLSPFSCVMSKCIRSLQHRGSCVWQNWSLSGFCRAAPTLLRSADPSAAWDTCRNGWLTQLERRQMPSRDSSHHRSQSTIDNSSTGKKIMLPSSTPTKTKLILILDQQRSCLQTCFNRQSFSFMRRIPNFASPTVR